ncbi:tetratricopeptide repeat protein [[Clostridium] colinum]|uniref:tetratricopeptide repeat protein n=1 Tax=[Clostridium] colinum TaxID=36835 RepID=UPI0020250999|nr:tetratricopeptide repeat protein [[Clostridium] colinum]
MKCPICGLIIQNDHICPRCNENAYVLNKIFNISVRLYNEALEKAHKKDFSNAIFLLEKSLCFNKNNTEVINLLGLLYYHTGRLGDAIKQWILSTNINPNKDNRAFYYLNIFNQNIRKFEKLDDAVRLYNQAIKYLKNRDDDLAVIRLKKALDINPKFIDAMNLLSFCYIVQKKYKKALKVLNKVLLLDTKNEIALKYIEEIEARKNKKKNKKEILSEEYTHNGMIKTVDEDEEYSKIKYNNKNLVIIFSFVFGVLLCALCMYFLFIPDYKSKKTDEIEQLNNTINTIKEETKNFILKKDEELKKVQQENQEIKNKLQIYENKKAIDDNYQKIDIALNLYKQGKKTEAKNMINSINTNGFDTEAMKKYNEVKNKINK